MPSVLASESSSIPESSSSQAPPRQALIFDYDWSLINCNSDTFIFEKLWPERPEVVQEIYPSIGQWTKSVDRALALLYEEKKDMTIDAILDCVAQVPVQEHMLEAVQYARARGVHLYIVSDANTAFIEAFLRRQGILDYFEAVISNHALLDCFRFQVEPYHNFDTNTPHGCPLCPPNMCKGQILEEKIDFRQYAKVVYVGDGGGDFCPSTCLQAGSVVLARSEYPLAKKLADKPPVAVVKEWSTGSDVLRIVQEELK